MVLLVLLLSLVTELRLLEDDHHGKLQFEIYILFPDFITFLRHHIAHNDNQRVT